MKPVENERPTASDVQILRAVAQKDERALGTLYDRYGSLLYSFALRMTQDPHVAEEAVQNVFLSVWRSADTFDERRSAVSTWLVTILKNRTRDLLRTIARRPTPAVIDWDLADDRSLDPSADSEERLRAATVRHALSLLPEEQRRVVQLTYYLGYSHRETAELLGIPLGTVKSRLRLALERLSVTLNRLDI